jgi:hypothetical protein
VPWSAAPGAYPPAARRSGRRGRLPLLTVALLLVGALAAAAWVGLVPGVRLRGSATPGTGDPIAAAGAAAGKAEFCRLAQQQVDEVTTALGGRQPDLKAMLEQARTRSRQMVAVAPAEIRGDLQTVQAAGEPVLESVLEQGEPSAEALSRLRSPAVLVAGKRVADYLQSDCGIQTPLTGFPAANG